MFTHWVYIALIKMRVQYKFGKDVTLKYGTLHSIFVFAL